MAEPEKNFLQQTIDWLSSLKASFDQMRERIGRLGAISVLLLAASCVIWWQSDHIAKLPGVESFLAWFNQRALPIAPAGRLTIAVAHLRDDEGQKQEKLLRDELGQFEGVELQLVDRTIEWPVANSESEAKKIAEEDARGLLKKTRAAVLIWGSVISSNGKSAMRLYWTPARDVAGVKSTGKYQPQTETIALPEAFWDDLKQILGLLSQSRLTEFTGQSGHYVADKLAPLIAQVRALVQSKEGEWNPETFAGVQFALATALFDFGAQSGTNEPLDESIELYHKILDEYTRARAPLEWAKTQMNLGLALETLGGRESGTARLEEAVAAYRKALQENTRARVPLDWARTQGNLGNALVQLGEREGRTALLEEAAAAYREALQELTRARVPLDWAGAQMGLGVVLATLGQWEGGTAKLEEAAAAFRDALQENTRARAARLGYDPERSRQCTPNARRAGGRDVAARGGRRSLSRSLAGKYPRARAARLGQNPGQSR